MAVVTLWQCSECGHVSATYSIGEDVARRCEQCRARVAQIVASPLVTERRRPLAAYVVGRKAGP